MNRSWKSLKSITVLLLVMEFLTPAILTGMLPSDPSGGYQAGRHLDWFRLKNPSAQLGEVLEESRPENRDHEVSPALVPKSHSFTSFEYSILRVLIPVATGNQFVTHPPLFTLHCLLLV